MQTTMYFDFLKRLAKGLAAQFGSDCEVVIHDLRDKNSESTIIAIENGHVTNRKVGGGPSHIALETMAAKTDRLEDHLDYMTQTSDGRMIKSSSVYIRDDEGAIIGIFCINYDITRLGMAEGFLRDFLHTIPQTEVPEKIPQNVNELLDELIEAALKHVDKPVAIMKKADKIKAIQYLRRAGAFQILKSGDKVCKVFKISKFTLYNYIDSEEETEEIND
ncbi:helix-turn-helix transcriptional regulator [Synergistaceae bacterium OttesenSCG-928-D05]|nr:helix-turn-helix transcriptional regulator [Synergistaceae bacterium OttesenSCG-928-D05]